jgi:hypothetical protein
MLLMHVKNGSSKQHNRQSNGADIFLPTKQQSHFESHNGGRECDTKSKEEQSTTIHVHALASSSRP